MSKLPEWRIKNLRAEIALSKHYKSHEWVCEGGWATLGPGPSAIEELLDEIDRLGEELKLYEERYWSVTNLRDKELEENQALKARVAAQSRIVDAALDLFHRGYDGPMIGEDIQELNSALIAYEQALTCTTMHEDGTK